MTSLLGLRLGPHADQGDLRSVPARLAVSVPQRAVLLYRNGVLQAEPGPGDGRDGRIHESRYVNREKHASKHKLHTCILC